MSLTHDFFFILEKFCDMCTDDRVWVMKWCSSGEMYVQVMRYML